MNNEFTFFLVLTGTFLLLIGLLPLAKYLNKKHDQKHGKHS